MSLHQLSTEAMALPLAERAALAQQLWASLDDGLSTPNEQSIMAEVFQRDEELSNGTVTGRTHGEVMAAARRAIA
jgi:putative addiction module component (TIGR02574 family)